MEFQIASFSKVRFVPSDIGDRLISRSLPLHPPPITAPHQVFRRHKSNVTSVSSMTKSFVLSSAICFLLILTPHGVFSEGARQEKETVILISMDGMGWQYISGQFADKPNLDAVGRNGVRAQYTRNVVPTKTWPTHHSYLTGLHPERHGIVSNRFWDPVYHENFIFDYDCSNNDPKFYNASEPIWLTLQKQGGRSGVYFWPGSRGYQEKPTYYEKPICLVNCSAIEPKDLPKYRNKTRTTWPSYIHCMPNYTEPFKSRLDKVIKWLRSDKPPQFVAVYIDHPDWEGHDYGSQSKEYKAAIEKVDREVVGYLTDRLRDESLLDIVNLIFVSDHSFNNISSNRRIFLDDYLDQRAYMMTESGALGHIWPKDGKLEEIFDNLTKVPNRHMKVYKRKDIPESYHWKHNRRIPPIFIDPEVGWSIGQSRGNSNATWVYGSHGWPPEESRSYPIFFARGPAFKKNFEVQPFSILDLYPLMCHLLGIAPQPNNGSMENVMSMLRGSTTNGTPIAGQTGVVTRAFVVLETAFICALIYL